LAHQVNSGDEDFARIACRQRWSVMKPAYPMLLFALLATQPLWAEVYKWTDADGNTIYSQVPPNNGPRPETVAPPPPPAETAEQAKARLNALQQKLEDAREDRTLRAQKQQKLASEAAARRENCARARANLQGLEQRARQLVGDGKGNYQRLTPEDKAKRSAEYKKIIKRDCGN
jgi:hypothetical protein